jgi:hypothetical protein
MDEERLNENRRRSAPAVDGHLKGNYINSRTGGTLNRLTVDDKMVCMFSSLLSVK